MATFNPGRNKDQKSLLRVFNSGTNEAAVDIDGIDDAGNASAGSVAAEGSGRGGARTVPAASLESEDSREEMGLQDRGALLEGELGSGTGKWRLMVESDRPVWVMSLLESPDGQLTNLSTAPDSRAGTL